MLYIGNTGRLLKTRFDIQASAVIGNDANQHVARYVRLIVAITMFQTRKLEPSVPFLVVMIATKRHEMLLISKLGTVHPYGINKRFSYV
jgi:hypothetical protein